MFTSRFYKDKFAPLSGMSVVVIAKHFSRVIVEVDLIVYVTVVL